ncbi:hypothetical protein AAC387_Pa06g2412 [Persea americana]
MQLMRGLGKLKPDTTEGKSHFHFRYRGHFPLSSSSQRTLAIFPPFIFVDLSAVIWEIRDRSQLSLSARSLLSLSALNLCSRSQLDLSLSVSPVEISGSSPVALLSSIELSRLCSPSLVEISLGTASFSCVVSPNFEVLSLSRRAFLPSLLLSLSRRSPSRYF